MPVAMCGLGAVSIVLMSGRKLAHAWASPLLSAFVHHTDCDLGCADPFVYLQRPCANLTLRALRIASILLHTELLMLVHDASETNFKPYSMADQGASCPERVGLTAA